MTLHLADVAAKDGGGTTIAAGVRFNDESGAGTGPYDQAAVLIDSTQAEILGTTADAAVAAGAAGSIGAKLRSISRDIVSNIVLAVGSAVIGKVGIDQTTPGTTNAVQATNASFGAANSPVVTNPTSTLTLPAATTAYGVGNLIANNATAGSVVVPSFALANSAGAARIGALVLTSNDSTSTAWGGQTIQIDLWRSAPTFTNGDRAAYAVATGSANYIGSFTGVLSPVAGDGVYGRFIITAGNDAALKLAAGTSVFWTMQSLTGSGVTGASKVFTLTPEVSN